MSASSSASLVVGPLLRYVDETRATIFVETDRACEVEVRISDGRAQRAPTWSVHGHNYALVPIEELAPATTHEYSVWLERAQVWPLANSPYPPSVIRTPDPEAPFRLAFGSCRRAVPFDEEHFTELGADALVALAARMCDQPQSEWPDSLMMLGDQVYADELSDAIAERLHAKHGSRDSDVADEIRDYEEYTWLYCETWMVPPVRWLLSTVPSGMLLDDHDLRDDWNTSQSWRDCVTRQDWWRDRVIGAYSSYWVYQHLGNLSPDDLATEPVYEAMRTLPTDEARTRRLDAFAWGADVDATTARFSFDRTLGSEGLGVRLVAIDSRCSRQLDPDDRRMVDPVEWAWVRDAVLGAEGGAVDHLVLCSTLPFLMIPGVHHLEGWNEAVAQGAWGSWPAKFGEWFRQFLDLEHWAAFRESFAETTDLLEEVVNGDSPPATILLLGGDVHCSYTARAELRDVQHPDTEIHQLTMSPFRNDIERSAKHGNKLLGRTRWAGGVHRLAKRANVDDVAIDWNVEHGPWFENGVMILTFAGRSARLEVERAHVRSGHQQVLERVLTFELNSVPVTVTDATASAED